jgi:hypothetical protein
MVPPVQTPRSELQVEAEEARATERRNEAEAAGMLIDEAPPAGAEQTAGPVAHLLDAELAAQRQAATAEAADVTEVVDVAEPAPDAESAALEVLDRPEAPAEPAQESESASLDVDGVEPPASDLEIAAAGDLFQQPATVAEVADVAESAPDAESAALEVLDQPEAPAEPALKTPLSELQVEAEEALAIERRNEAEAAGMLIDEAPPVGAQQPAGPVVHLLDAELAAQHQAAAAEAAGVGDVVDVAAPAPDVESAALEVLDQPEAEEYAGDLLDAGEGSGGMIAEPETETPVQDPFVEEPVVEPQHETAADSTEPELELSAEAEAPEAAEASPAEVAELQPQPAPDDDDLEQEDVVSEVEKILRVKRWEKRNKPFRGFGSPPGRF